MSKVIKVIFFDLGNTLIYDDHASWRDIYMQADHSLWSSLHQYGINLTSQDLFGVHKTLLEYYYNKRAGDLEEPGVGKIFRQILNKHNIYLSDENLNTTIRSMYAVTQTNWHLEDDAVPAVQALLDHGYKLGIISNGSDELNTYELLEKVKLRPYFEYILSSAAFGKRKPHPGIFRAALEHFHVTAEESIMVGDDYEADILGSISLGMRPIWITKRVHHPPEESHIDERFIVSKLSEILALLSP
jgi:HAD superfamily hydrolase (TIGR01662 family)